MLTQLRLANAGAPVTHPARLGTVMAAELVRAFHGQPSPVTYFPGSTLLTPSWTHRARVVTRYGAAVRRQAAGRGEPDLIARALDGLLAAHRSRLTGAGEPVCHHRSVQPAVRWAAAG